MSLWSEKVWSSRRESDRRCQQTWSVCHHGCYVCLESIMAGEMFCRSHYGNRIRKYRQWCPKVDRVAPSEHIKWRRWKFCPSEKKKKRNKVKDEEICLAGQAKQCLTEMIKLLLAAEVYLCAWVCVCLCFLWVSAEEMKASFGVIKH